jgi:uncharacterized membrane protein YsdA (DUF1294 family)
MYKDTKENVLGIYIANFLIAIVVFFLMYFLMSTAFSKYTFFIGMRKILDMSQELYVYLMAMTFTTMIIYFYDKSKAVTGLGMRVPELVLHILEAFGGSVGAILSQNLFNHKKRKTSFYRITWMIFVIQGTFLSLPYILKLPHDQQVLIAIAVPVLLLILYFLDAVIGILSTLYALIVIAAFLFALYYFFNMM